MPWFHKENILRKSPNHAKNYRFVYALGISVIFSLSVAFLDLYSLTPWKIFVISGDIAEYRAQVLEQCEYIKKAAGPGEDFYSRTESDRFVPGTAPVYLKNAKIWTGARNGSEVIYGDIFLDKGLVKALGYVPPRLLENNNYEFRDVQGAWITPGLVDLHSHIGVDSSPELNGSFDSKYNL